MMMCTTACIGILFVVGGILWLYDQRIVNTATLGTVSGGGLLAVLGLLVGILKLSIKH